MTSQDRQIISRDEITDRFKDEDPTGIREEKREEKPYQGPELMAELPENQTPSNPSYVAYTQL